MSDSDPAITSKQWEAIARQRLCIIRELEKAIAAAVPILKALAAADEPEKETVRRGIFCPLCSGVPYLFLADREGPPPETSINHEPTCAWRLAQQWTKEYAP